MEVALPNTTTLDNMKVMKMSYWLGTFFKNNYKRQTILIVNTVLKLFGYLTTRDQITQFWNAKSTTLNSISTSSVADVDTWST